MNHLQRKADLVKDIVEATTMYESWDHSELDTWDAIQSDVDNILQVHRDMMMLESAIAFVGLDQNTYDRTYIELEVQWDKGRDSDSFVLYVKSNKKDLVDDYERAMGVV
jgi:hypothetical protein